MDFTMFAGDTKRLMFSITSGPPANAPLDISDATVTWQASRGNTTRFSKVPVLTKTIGNGVEVTDELSGNLTVELLPADTASLAGTYYHELQITDAAGDVATAFAGEFKVLRNLIP